MKRESNKTIIFLTILLLFLISLFLFSIFKNIQYPLIWGDEAETAMFAERILDYGYPKVHDSKNSLDLHMISGSVGVNKKYDAGTVSMWGQYYFTTIGGYLARSTSDIYLKTAFLRIPHAIIGFLGILFAPFILLPKIILKERKILFWSIYFLFSILSVSLILHIKEVRSYSLSIFFSSTFLNIFVYYYFYKKINRIIYYISGTLTLFLLINSFPPGYLSLSAGVASYIFIKSVITNRNFIGNKVVKIIKESFIGAIPIIISGLIQYPILSFFETSKVSAQSYKDMHFGLDLYIIYMRTVVGFLYKYHFIILFLFLLFALFVITAVKKNKFLENILIFIKTNKLLVFLTFILIVYIPVVSFTPYMFDRYFIFLQVIINLLIAYLFVNVLKYLSKISDKKNRDNYKFLFFYGLVLVFGFTLVIKLDILKGRVYELTHKYVGPMDFIVLYIKENFKNTEKLVIDTNSEQPVLIYYLGSKVLCDDSLDCYSTPSDIIIPRRGILKKEFVDRINTHMELAEYKEVRLPILDYPANNIPELSLSLRHLFKTPHTENDNEKIILLVKNKYPI
jgi:hypothetical protein